MGAPQLLLAAAVTGATMGANVVGWWLDVDLASVSVLNLLLVLLLARSFGILAATIASVTAVVSMDFLLIPPIYTLTVADPRNWVALGVFETCALLVARLSNQAASQSRLAIRERMESQRLYEVSRQMLLFERDRSAGPQIVDLLQRVFQPEAVVLFDCLQARVDFWPDAEGAANESMEAASRTTCFSGSNSFDRLTGTWYCVVRLGNRATGSLGVRSKNISGSAADSLALLAAIALERERALQAESFAIAERHTEQLRTTVLDALAHEFKTPLTTIRTASGGLIGLNRWQAEEKQLLHLIDEAAVKLADLTTKALRTAKLDSAEAAPCRSRLELGDVVKRLLQAADRTSGHEFITVTANASAPLQADIEMLTLGLSQLLDNAVRYSEPGSRITLESSADEYEIRICVKNPGPAIPPYERFRIFDRYYRIPGTSQRANGSGLGLCIAKRIVEAHSGRIWVDSEKDETAFVAVLPRDRRNE